MLFFIVEIEIATRITIVQLFLYEHLLNLNRFFLNGFCMFYKTNRTF